MFVDGASVRVIIVPTKSRSLWTFTSDVWP